MTDANRGPQRLTVAAWSRQASRRLAEAGAEPDVARRDSAAMVRAALGWSLTDWALHQQQPLDTRTHTLLDGWLERRLAHEPVAYLTGTREFFGRGFLVTRDVLIPRPETELAVEVVCALLNRTSHLAPSRPFILDVGTGSGALAITLALELPAARVTATDISGAALGVARTNAARLGASDRIAFVEANGLGEAEQVDVVVSNPPYISTHDGDYLPPDVREYEPASALFGGEDGLDVIRLVTGQAASALVPGGWLVFEIGSSQADAVRLILESAGFEWQGVHRDLAGHDRVVVGRSPSNRTTL